MGMVEEYTLSQKDLILTGAQTRATQGKSTTAVICGRKVDTKKLRRRAKQLARQERIISDSSSRLVNEQAQVFGSFLPFGNKMFSRLTVLCYACANDYIFANWNMPFGVSSFRMPQSLTFVSPVDFDLSATTQ